MNEEKQVIRFCGICDSKRLYFDYHRLFDRISTHEEEIQELNNRLINLTKTVGFLAKRSAVVC